MLVTERRDYQLLNNLEQNFGELLRKALNRERVSLTFSPWLLFWAIAGGFFFAAQAYLWLHALAEPFSTTVEYFALAAGVVIGTFFGFLVMLFAPNRATNWRLPTRIFLLWMVVPTMFPILFLVGIFSSNEGLIALQASPWRAAIEYLLFGVGLTILYIELRRNPSRLINQGALTIILLSLLFIGKNLVSDGFYLAGTCPKSTLSHRMAWLSNTEEEVRAYKKQTAAEKFYNSPAGQFICTRTQVDLFR